MLTAFVGGLAASAGLAAAGLLLWVLSIPEVAASIPAERALHFLVFLSGGPAFAVAFGILSGSVSLATHRARVLPTWIIQLGAFVAATGFLSLFGLVSLGMTVAVPITRLAGFLWLVVAAANLSA